MKLCLTIFSEAMAVLITVPRTSSIVQYFPVSEDILRYQKFICLDSFSNQRLMYVDDPIMNETY